MPPSLSWPRWELAAETVAVKIRGLGLALGYVYVNTTPPFDHQLRLNFILALGLVYTILDTIFSLRGRVFLGRYPLVTSSMEALFIGLLCFYHGGLASRFEYYYVLSLICCAIRHPIGVTYATCAMHCCSLTVLYLALPETRREPFALILMILILNWVTWAAAAMARLLKHVGDYLGRLNTELEGRIAERTRELQEAQAQVLHQEKMAAFGLLAAGIAHEVGNPLTAVSSIVQLLERRNLGPAVQEKLGLVSGQLHRIRDILHELVTFSRPASTERIRLSILDAVYEALSIAKYYRGTKSRQVTTHIPQDLPPVFAVRGQLVQVLLNLVLNAVDATTKRGRIEIAARVEGGGIVIEVADDGHGIAAGDRERLFQPYFTTKKQGTGLGLFVCRSLLSDLGGSIEVDDRPGGGTVFRVVLPAGLPDKPIPPTEAYAAIDSHRG